MFRDIRQPDRSVESFEFEAEGAGTPQCIHGGSLIFFWRIGALEMTCHVKKNALVGSEGKLT